MLLAAPVGEADSAAAEEDAVELAESRAPDAELLLPEVPEVPIVADAELLGARLLVAVAADAPVEVRKSELMHDDWHAAYASVSAADPSP